MKVIDLRKTLESYQSGWVSISQDYKKVLAWGKTLKSLLRKINESGDKSGVIMKAAKSYSHYIGANEGFV